MLKPPKPPLPTPLHVYGLHSSNRLTVLIRGGNSRCPMWGSIRPGVRKYNFVSRISTGGYFSKGVLVMNDTGFGPDLLIH